MRVDFFIAGVQKGGTTALDHLLRRHPSLRMAAVKEPHFFDDDTLDWTAPNYEILHANFDQAQDVLRGEATPIYTYWPGVANRLYAYNAGAKLIVALRQPSCRAFSHWRMEVTRGADPLTFAEAIRDGRRRVAAAPGGVHRVFSYVERGFYAPQIERLLGLFHRGQIHFLRTDRLWSEPESTLRRIQEFLGVPPMPLARSREYVVPLTSAELGAPSDDDLSLLGALFHDDIHRTSKLTGLDLQDWLAVDYREPMSLATSSKNPS